MAKKRIKATKLTVGLPFNLGELEFEPDEVQQRAAWELYVELTTRTAVQPLGKDEGLGREALSSLYSVFDATREILRHAGPTVAQGPNSFGPIAIEVLNKGLRPFLTKWHPLLLAHEQKCPTDVSAHDHELSWDKATEFRQEFAKVQGQMLIYAEVLAQIAGDNKRSQKFVARFGFYLLTVIPQADPSGSLLLYALYADQCKWLHVRRHHGKTLAPAPA